MGKTKKNAMSIAAVLLGIAILVLDLVNPQAGRAVITVLLLATTVMAFVFAGKASTDSRYRPRFLLVGHGHGALLVQPRRQETVARLTNPFQELAHLGLALLFSHSASMLLQTLKCHGGTAGEAA